MSTLLLTPRRVTCGAVYEQLMNAVYEQLMHKEFQQGRGSVRLNSLAATAARRVRRKRLASAKILAQKSQPS
jgi:hypothetical protein